jgi:hypothetical protein
VLYVEKKRVFCDRNKLFSLEIEKNVEKVLSVLGKVLPLQSQFGGRASKTP